MTAKFAQGPGLAEFATTAVGVLRIVDLRIQRAPGLCCSVPPKCSTCPSSSRPARYRMNPPPSRQWCLDSQTPKPGTGNYEKSDLTDPGYRRRHCCSCDPLSCGCPPGPPPPRHCSPVDTAWGANPSGHSVGTFSGQRVGLHWNGG